MFRHLAASRSFLACFALTFALGAAVFAQERQAEPAKTPSQVDTSDAPVAGPFARIVTIGASVTDGFANGMPIARMIEGAVVVEHRRVERIGSSMFFMKPGRYGADQVRRAKKLKASFVIAVDYLFWYAYGPKWRLNEVLQATGVDESERKLLDEARGADRGHRTRMLSFERGLRQLASLDVPLLVGDIPDMTGASARMLQPRYIPKKMTLDALNARLRAWAKARKNVRIVPLSTKVQIMKAGKLTIPAEGEKPAIPLSAAQVLAGDRLHTSRIGAIVFASELVMEMQAWHPKYASALRFDVRERLRLKGFGELLTAPVREDSNDDPKDAKSSGGGASK